MSPPMGKFSKALVKKKAGKAGAMLCAGYRSPRISLLPRYFDEYALVTQGTQRRCEKVGSMAGLRFVVMKATLLGTIVVLSAIPLQALFASAENGAPTVDFISSADVKEG
jgi:hypothetical protein